LAKNDPPAPSRRQRDPNASPLTWSARWSLTSRILAVNIFAVAMLAGSFFYLDSYRQRVAEERTEQAADDVQMMGQALFAVTPAQRPQLAARMAAIEGERLRIYGPDGRRVLDTWSVSRPTYDLIDPETQPWKKRVARFMDRSFDRIMGTDASDPFEEPAIDRRDAWPEAKSAAAKTGSVVTEHRSAPDRTPVLSAAIDVPGLGTLLTTNNVRDITRIVRAERFAIGVVISGVLVVSVLLSLYLARTIVRPLRRLAVSAHRVRLGRAREVQVPRLPSRRDEIGLLARALSDMSQALRRRIDAVEAFAADVSHELKNPLASLRSAVDGLGVIKDEALQTRLLDIVRDDVMRLDRLITDVADISRLDGELSRARFEAVDLGPLIEAMFAAREERGRNGDVRVAFARPYVDTAVVFGDPVRLARMIENLVDNAVSFSPPGGLVEVSAIGIKDIVLIAIEDEGPGVPPDKRDAIFRRFHSDRPDGEAPERHSGLGLAIAKAIADGHDGTIEVRDRQDGRSGAHFLVTLPRAPDT
jgi:two-component system, OmpR family, sensor histidine kinase ChvG